MPKNKTSPLRSKRLLTMVWLAAATAAFLLASAPWYWVLYNLDAVEKQLEVTGIKAWPLIPGQILFALVTLAAVFLSRGKVRVFIAWANAVIASIITFNNLAGIFATIGGNKLPAVVDGMISKSSGIAGGGVGGGSASIVDYAHYQPIQVAFVAAALVLLGVQIRVALVAGGWASQDTRDKYVRQPVAEPKKTGKKAKPKKGDNISLWDSQR